MSTFYMFLFMVGFIVYNGGFTTYKMKTLLCLQMEKISNITRIHVEVDHTVHFASLLVEFIPSATNVKSNILFGKVLDAQDCPCRVLTQEELFLGVLDVGFNGLRRLSSLSRKVPGHVSSGVGLNVALNLNIASNIGIDLLHRNMNNRAN